MSKRRKNAEKSRTIVINTTIEAGDSINFLWSEEQQKLSIDVIREGKSISARSISKTVLYKREKKPKVLNVFTAYSNRDFSFVDEDIIKKYRQVWSVDTNTRPVFGYMLNISGICALDPAGSGNIQEIALLFSGGVEGSAEQYSIASFVNFLNKNNYTDMENKYAIITDTQISRISKFNLREEPLYGDFYLPENFTLIYATSDSGQESYLNQSIRSSDRLSSRAFKRISENQDNNNFFEEGRNGSRIKSSILFLNDICI